MDDGTKKESTYSFATASFSLEEHDILLDVLKTKFGLTCNIQGQKYRNIYVSIKDGSNKKFETMVEPYIFPSMRYKLNGRS